MLTFKKYMESEEDDNIKDTLDKLPQNHSDLVRGYRFTLKGGNTLPGDDDHIGYMDDHKKHIAVAAPWNYGREFTVLHEIGHRVWEKLIPDELKHKWKEVVARTKNKQKQSAEELFCMAYANYYAQHKMVIHDHPEWNKFIRDLPK
jgi:hypothetical protein